MNIKIHTPQVPEPILKALDRAKLNYSSANTVFHFLWLGGDWYCGVFGDGDNGCYEWFEWHKGTLEHSDCAYGQDEVALRDVLMKVTEYEPDTLKQPIQAPTRGDLGPLI